MIEDPAKGLPAPHLGSETFHPNDIIKGHLADSWILSALIGMADRPALVDRIFITKEYNEQGIYELRLCKNGEW